MIIQETFLPIILDNRENRFVEKLRDIPPYDSLTWNVYRTFGVSNSVYPRPVDKRIFFGGPNLGSFPYQRYAGICIATVLRFITGTELFMAFYVQSSLDRFEERMRIMVSRGEDRQEGYSTSNNNTKFVYSMENKKFLLFNKKIWETIDLNDPDNGPDFDVDKVVYSVFPPGKPSFQSLAAGEFIRYLIDEFGEDKVDEISAWAADEVVVTQGMQRAPSRISLDEIFTSIRSHNLTYGDDLIPRLHVSLNHLDHKHFVILKGLSGTGKTSLAIAYAHAIHGITEPNQFDPFLFVIPVRPEWTDPAGLTGYFDVLSHQYIVPPFLEAIFTALSHPGSPVFICLDELNLARVEYYLSDIISVLETYQPIRLHSFPLPVEGTTGIPVPSEVRFPDNLYVIGTINIDETTNPISDKVLDRAVVIDTSKVNLDDLFTILEARNPSLITSIQQSSELLKTVHECLTPHNLQFGYRVTTEIIHYLHFASTELGLNAIEAIDEQLTQKILVKMRGDFRQADLLDQLRRMFEVQGLQRSSELITFFQDQLDTLGSFQYAR